MLEYLLPILFYDIIKIASFIEFYPYCDRKSQFSIIFLRILVGDRSNFNWKSVLAMYLRKTSLH